ncbi:S26 family signal peptidase [Sphingomonas sp.]|jgi:conjugative transfer signal peptidase TraF|uniref:S26 family signal peptidase n=1 Tax=Sphingomonas sp. TaxID=28214 RepID=UPI003562A152
MTDRRDPPGIPPQNLPLFAHAAVQRDALRAARLRRNRLRRRCAVAAAGIALVELTIARPPLPRLIWNASASAPLGLYAVSPDAPLARGDMVVAWAPPAPRALAAARHYLPANVPLVKRVRAVAGDRVCAIGTAISVDGRHIADRLLRDRAGRPMPWWHGCTTLGRGALLLLNDAPASFDGRYFGPSRRTDVIGKATPLWLR